MPESGIVKKALIFWGGWDGHEPESVAGFAEELLNEAGFQTEVSDSLASLDDLENLAALSLIVPVWTMGQIGAEQCKNVCTAVSEHGVGLGGFHGGMCDAFRESTEWHYMTGGQWVAHPGDDGVRYSVQVCRGNTHPVTDGIEDFEVVSEQYYLHVDPANNVLATCEFPNPSVPDQGLVGRCHMPTVWTRQHGLGRVFYCALGHKRSVLEQAGPKEICRRGLLWAAGCL